MKLETGNEGRVRTETGSRQRWEAWRRVRSEARARCEAFTLVPLCSFCLRARTAAGEWVELPASVLHLLARPTAPVRPTHGLCPTCRDTRFLGET